MSLEEVSKRELDEIGDLLIEVKHHRKNHEYLLEKSETFSKLLIIYRDYIKEQNEEIQKLKRKIYEN